MVIYDYEKLRYCQESCGLLHVLEWYAVLVGEKASIVHGRAVWAKNENKLDKNCSPHTGTSWPCAITHVIIIVAMR